MKRTKLADRQMPVYTKGEEIFNMVSHIVGGAMGILAIVICAVFAGLNGDVCGVVAGCIFGATMLVLYTSSSIYHGLKSETFSKRVFQVIDYCTIFILIVGTYTCYKGSEYSGWLDLIWCYLGICNNRNNIQLFIIL